jgi:hypothetical protein
MTDMNAVRTGAAQREPPLTLRNYMSQCARQHTDAYCIGLGQNNFSKKMGLALFLLPVIKMITDP